MESPSAPAHRQLVPWKEFLLAGSLLIFWSLPMSQQLHVMNLDAPEGKDALLNAQDLPPDTISLKWYKGNSADNDNHLIGSCISSTKICVSGPANNSRQIMSANGSLLFQKVTLEDTGSYTLQVTKVNTQTEKTTARLRVFPELPTPTLTTANINPQENKDPIVFYCEPFTVNTTYRWLVNNRTHAKSSNLRNVFTIKLASRKDTGAYQCETRNPVSVRLSNTINLSVVYGPETPIIIPKDFQYYPGGNLNLSCNAVCNPPAEYTWIFHGVTVNHTPELFIPRITEKHSGVYTCLALNPVTGLNKTAVQNIAITVLTDKTIVGIVIGVLLSLAAIAAMVCALFLRN
ncbi:cell adhesion molecule CEACAM6-like [Molossus nigricans]